MLDQYTALPHVPRSLALGGLIAALIGSILILPMLRTRGHYAALITIAFGILFKRFLEVNDTLGGPQGLKVPGDRPVRLVLQRPDPHRRHHASFYLNYRAAGARACWRLRFVLVRRLERSWIGLSLDASGSMRPPHRLFGLDLARWKILAFTLGNFLAGMAGAVYGHDDRASLRPTISPSAIR